MSTTKDVSFVAQPDWFVSLTVAGGAITATPAGKDATVVYTGLGIYTVTLGSSGIDSAHCDTSFDYEGAAGLFWRVTHTSATAKIITVTNSANAAADITSGRVKFRRLV